MTSADVAERITLNDAADSNSHTWSSSLAFSPLCLIAHKLIPKTGG